MKKTASLIIALTLSSFFLQADAQKIKTVSGNDDVLKSESTINIEFTYDDISVGKFADEKEYIKTKTAEYNAKEPGKGDTWAKNWINDRQTRYEPKFIELYTLTSKKTISKDAKYTLIFKTKSIEPGYNIAGGMMIGGRKNAQVDAEVWIVETANRDNKVCVVSILDVPGGTAFGYDFDTGLRISEAFANAGKKLAKSLK